MANHGIQRVMSGFQTVIGIAAQIIWFSDIQKHLLLEKLR